MGGKRSRDKGNRSERDLVHRAKAAGIKAWRVPLSGAQQGYPDDVILERADGEQLHVECKVRADGFKQIYSWLGDSDILAIKADHKEWLVVVRVEELFDLLTGKQKGVEG